ncbi:MAG: hypothetical protein LVR00_08540 [Rhabdochlamydiaceae bacterium]|jgi:hypothetical protein
MKTFLMILIGACVKLQALYFGNPASPQIIEEGFFIPLDSVFSFKLGFEKIGFLTENFTSMETQMAIQVVLNLT